MNPEYMSPDLQKRLDNSRGVEDEKAMDMDGTKVLPDGRLEIDRDLNQELHKEGDKAINTVRELDIEHNRETKRLWAELVEESKKVDREFYQYAVYLAGIKRAKNELVTAILENKDHSSVDARLQAYDKDPVGGARQNVYYFLKKAREFVERTRMPIPLFLTLENDDVALNFKSEGVMQMLDEVRRAEIHKANEKLGREVNF